MDLSKKGLLSNSNVIITIVPFTSLKTVSRKTRQNHKNKEWNAKGLA